MWKRIYSKRFTRDCLGQFLRGPFKYDHPQLIQYIRANILDPPSSLPYNFNPESFKRIHRSEQFYDKYTEKLLRFKRNGFFVEAGALDGQTMSNTLGLEMKQGWTGLLIEPDPSSYNLLRQKHRKAWSAKSCLSITGYPKTEMLSTLHVKPTRGTPLYQRSMGSIYGQNHTLKMKTDHLTTIFYERQCFPLESFLLALNVTRVDLLSLDIEFFEKQILEHFDFNRFDIQVIYIEWWDHKSLVWLHEFMKKRDFYFVRNIEGDIIYVKKNSEAHRIAVKEKLQRPLYIFVKSNQTTPSN